MSTATRPILVTAASGQTGGHTARQLREMGHPVRAMVHQDDHRARALRELGAEVVVGDVHDLGTLRAAMDGIERSYFCHPWVPRVLEGTTNFAFVAQECGMRRTVNMSQIIAREGHPSPATREHWLGERVLDWAGVGAVHIRPGLFADNLIGLAGESVTHEGRIYLPFGQGAHAPVAAEDVASVVVGLLTSEEEELEPGRALAITGGEEMTMARISEVIGRVVGRSVEYVEIPLGAWLERLRSLPRMNDHFLAHLEQVAADVQAGRFAGVTDVVERVGGKPPMPLKTFVEQHIESFGGHRATAS